MQSKTNVFSNQNYETRKLTIEWKLPIDQSLLSGNKFVEFIVSKRVLQPPRVIEGDCFGVRTDGDVLDAGEVHIVSLLI